MEANRRMRILLLATLSGLAIAGGTVGTVIGEWRAAAFESRFGVKLIAARLDARSALVDVRYRVLDTEKAAPLLARDAVFELRDGASGQALDVPQFPKVGALRAKGEPIAGRSYFVLFGNTRGLVRAGSEVRLKFGGLEARPLTVQ
jgi:hypothetical protein